MGEFPILGPGSLVGKIPTHEIKGDCSWCGWWQNKSEAGVEVIGCLQTRDCFLYSAVYLIKVNMESMDLV